jgi:hypothetical protein
LEAVSESDLAFLRAAEADSPQSGYATEVTENTEESVELANLALGSALSKHRFFATENAEDTERNCLQF